MSAKPTTIPVDLGDRSYPIVVGQNLLPALGEKMCEELGTHRNVLVVSDENVAPHYLETVVKSLTDASYTVATCVFPAGEGAKSTSNLGALWKTAIEARLDRKSIFVALGGGVIGDLTGFAAASYLRGVDFVQVPTSLLAMVDSSVGGKTGINLPQGKNLVGAFHQPTVVLADLDVLRTLPARELNAGMAEVIKYGMIYDADLFEQLERDAARISEKEIEPMLSLVCRSCEIKSAVVQQDERESGVRAYLNFGHTLGHAIENVGGYGTLLHGEAISAGMMYAARLSEQESGLSAEETERLGHLLEAFQLPTKVTDHDWERLFRVMTADKKAQHAIPYFVLVSRIGQAQLPIKLDESLLETTFDSWLG